MCPSYMATREEDHATRGRANALVRALSQPDPHAALGDERLHEILDLCLECKACKRECPLDVDMATLKSEFLSHYQEIHGTPLRSRAFGAIRALNRAGAALAPVSNLVPRVPGARALLERTLGIARERPLPRFERETLLRWDARRARGPGRRRGATSSSWPTRSRRSPSRRSGARRSSCSSAPGGACGCRARAAAGGRASPRACSGRRGAWRGRWSTASRPRRGAARRSSASSPRASYPARRVPRAAAGRRGRRGRRRPGEARRRPARRGHRRG